jgi:4'-phosphopantetheinyl transferase
LSVSDWPLHGNASSPRELSAPCDRCSLWWCDLAGAVEDASTLAAWLSPAEHARSRRFASVDRANRYVAGRACLRWVLGRVLGLHPAAVDIERGARGRPQLVAPMPLDFNVSNTRDVALIGLSHATAIRIGVDVEHLDRPVRHASLARKFLTLREQDAVAGLDETAHRRAFLRSWTFKEAMSKATGEALGAPIRHLEVAFDAGPRLAAGPPPYVPHAWRLFEAAVPAGYVGAVALWQRLAAGEHRPADGPSTGGATPG